MAKATYFEQTWTVEPGGELPLPIAGDFLYVLAASQSTFGLGIDGEQTGMARPGARFEPDAAGGFREVRLTNLSPMDVLIATIGWGQGRFSLQQFRFITAGRVLSSADVAVAAGATQVVAPADTNRRRIRIGNPNSNPREVRVGDATVNSSRGAIIAPGQWEWFSVSGSISVHNPDTAAQIVTVLEVLE